MGWDTQIIILAENCQGKHLDIAQLIFEKDAKDYVQLGYTKIGYTLVLGTSTLFFTYERRKYLPYWVIQEISNEYKEVTFTVMASCPEFICGPAGLVKIKNGEIIDSYGFFEIRQSILEKPHAELIWQWFGKDKAEERIRQNYIPDHPQIWCEENYMDNLVEFTEKETEELILLIRYFENIPEEVNWIEIFMNEF